MGIRDLWKIVNPASQETTLTKLTWDFWTEKDRPMIIGVDASIWLFRSQTAICASGSHSQLGPNPELSIIFHKLSFFLKLPAVLIIVLDGTSRPNIKRGTKVKKAPHWMVKGLRELVEGFGYHMHQAPAEAEAELATMNKCGYIDAVLTDDSDVLVFDAPFIIRNPEKNSKDPDTVSTYNIVDINSNAETPIMKNGLLLFAILRGGDYDMGLPGCSTSISYALTNTELGMELAFLAEEESDSAAQYLCHWRKKLRHEIEEDPHHFIGRKYRKLAATIPPDFPSIRTIRSYTHPQVSNSFAGVLNLQLPDVPKLIDLAKKLFNWKSSGSLATKFRVKIFDAFCIRNLLVPDCYTSTIPVVTLSNAARPRSILNVKADKKSPSIILFSVSFNITELAKLYLISTYLSDLASTRRMTGTAKKKHQLAQAALSTLRQSHIVDLTLLSDME
ncbi:hypothetical protein E1B28_003734 [Marasmius oreades]|uniref:XPG-I domain-containing protein n=1 Tax=Marasmius oreades TaxID=181124 RepID=A0A9P7UX58_9AGAR|nr:uncharacterized protein E1B28_003734 [Marasmius oreades]KAG7096287.1 hypothetical protein E1B28_003734 [Marasmius oreades]